MDCYEGGNLVTHWKSLVSTRESAQGALLLLKSIRAAARRRKSRLPVLINSKGQSVCFGICQCLKEAQLAKQSTNFYERARECTALELYLSHNGIAKMEGLYRLENLRAIEDIEKLTCLGDLWFNDNQLASLNGIAEAVAGSREKLTTVYREHNTIHVLSGQTTRLP